MLRGTCVRMCLGACACMCPCVRVGVGGEEYGEGGGGALTLATPGKGCIRNAKILANIHHHSGLWELLVKIFKVGVRCQNTSSGYFVPCSFSFLFILMMAPGRKFD